MKRLYALLICFFLTATAVYADSYSAIDDAYGAGFTGGFDDLSGFEWAHEAINYFSENGIIQHSLDNKFHPDKPISREEFVEMLVAAFGIYDASAVCRYSDVPPRYAGSIASANAAGVVNGISENEFGFGQAVTRQDLVAMSYRMLLYLNMEIQGEYDILFDDAVDIADYAAPAVGKLVRTGIINGDNNNRFNPKKNTSRAEACKIVYLLMLKNA